MARKTLLKRVVSSFTAAALAIVAMPVIPAFAETGVTTYSFDGYDVEYSVKNEWTEGQSIEVKITNTGDEPILNWAFKYNAEGEISDLWNASVYDTKETSYIIKNAGWNYEIAPEASVSFGYTLSDYSGTNPDKFELCVKRVDKTEGYDVQYNITNEWDTGLQGEIVITNTSEEPLEAWELSFDSTFAINNLWNGKLISSEDNHYVVASEMWSNPIAAGESRTIGFTGIKSNESELSVDNYALSVVVIDTSENNGGNDNPEPNIDLTTDTDGDKVPDAYEKVYGTDPENPDTDGDGLTDYEEIALTNSDPLVYNSIDESLSDEEADYDKDGLSTREELTLGTDPTQADTDNDRINDYDEINVWHTNPLVADTDNDGIVDGDEIKIGLDPANPETFGYPDIKFKSTQHISEDSITLSSINNENNDIFTYSVDVTSNGYVEPYMYARESCYTSVMKNDFMIGVAPELVYLGNYDIDNIKVSFSISDEYIERTKSPEESKEDFLNRITIFRYFESANALLPVLTSIDEKTGALYTESNAVTTYCLMDRDAWINMLEKYSEEDTEEKVVETSLRMNVKSTKLTDELDIAETFMCSPPQMIDENNQTEDHESEERALKAIPMTRSIKIASDVGTKPISNKYIDVVFILQSAGTSRTYFDEQKETIAKISNALFLYSPNVKISILDYKYRSTSCKVEWYDKYTDVEKRLNSISYVSENNYCNRSAAFGSLHINDFRLYASKFIIHLVNGANINLSSSDHTSFCYDNKINLSELKPEGWKYDYESAEKRISEAIKSTGGLYEVFNKSKWHYYYQHIINNSAEPETEFKALVPTSWREITLNTSLQPDGERIIDTDSDNDGLSDWTEVNNKLLKWDSNGKIQQITLDDYYSEVEKFMLDELKDTYPQIDTIFKAVTCIPLLSDPTIDDGDGDGILDKDEFYGSIVNDSRYDKVSPLKADTVETLYPELSLNYINGNNKTSNPIYLSIEGDEITIKGCFAFFGKYDEFIPLDTSGITMGEAFKSGIKEYWEGANSGSVLDFYPGININIKTDFQYKSEIKISNLFIRDDRAVIVNFTDTCAVATYVKASNLKFGILGGGGIAGGTWKTNNYKTINISPCGNHPDEWYKVLGKCVNCYEYKNISYDRLELYKYTCAHEFGHVLGIWDAYGNDNTNNKYSITEDTTILSPSDKEFFNKELMRCDYIFSTGNEHELVVSNEIEMMLQAFSENEWQYFYEGHCSFLTRSVDQKLSVAIKSEYPTYQVKSDRTGWEYYYWDRTLGSMRWIARNSGFPSSWTP